MVDPTQVNTEQVFDEGYMQGSAIGSANRSYLSIVGQTAGVTGGSNPNVFGSTLGENAYYIDGQDTTDPVTATWAVQFNYDAIAEVELQTSGFEAEYGRATGGLVNVVTKSGGNQFSGTLDVRYRDQNFYTDGDHYDTSTLKTKYEDIAVTLGGPILRDKMWFFVAYEDVLSESTPQQFADHPQLGRLQRQRQAHLAGGLQLARDRQVHPIAGRHHQQQRIAVSDARCELSSRSRAPISTPPSSTACCRTA